MNEINKNKEAWNLLSKDHYFNYKKQLEENKTLLNDNIVKELGDIRFKSLIHLQCNIGQDTICLARMGLSKAVGVDLSNENIFYANKLKSDFKMERMNFIESDVLEFGDKHSEKYDIVFTSEGVLGWLPDLKKWAKVVKGLLKDDGFFYIYDSHPILHVFDDRLIAEKREFVLKYDYSNAQADLGYEIGGYATNVKHAENYWWNHSLSDIVNALIDAGLEIEYLHEFDTLFWDMGGMTHVGRSLYQYPEFRNKLPMAYSIKAKVRK